MPCHRFLKKKTIREVVLDSELRRVFMHNVHPRVYLSLKGRLDDGLSDRLVWSKDASGSVSTKSFMNIFAPKYAPVRKFEIIWQSWLPLKVSCFLWRILHRALPTNENVCRIGIPLVSKCVCCTISDCESMEHLFIYSEMACNLWNFLVPLLGKRRPNSVKDFFYDWGVNASLNRMSDLFAFGLSCMCLWEIWKLRNFRVFEDGADWFTNGIIFKCAASLAKCIPSNCKSDYKSRLICRALRLHTPKIDEFRVYWCAWAPCHGNSCNLAVHVDDDGARLSAIIRSPEGTFICAVKVVTTSKHFLKCLLQIIHELKSLRIGFVRLQTDHEDILLLGRSVSVDWRLYQLKSSLVEDLKKVDILRVSFSSNKPAKALCFDNSGCLKTWNFSDLPVSVKSALILDGCIHPCSFLDQSVFV